jgi:xylulose-5-phosphate/fructose-6-phosphate phosphoketolase
MVVLNDLDRFHLAGDVIDRVPGLARQVPHIKQILREKLMDHRAWVDQHGVDMPEIAEWTWKGARAVAQLI